MYPAELLGVDNVLGRIGRGYLANLAVFNNQLVVKGVVLCGKHEVFLNHLVCQVPAVLAQDPTLQISVIYSRFGS